MMNRRHYKRQFTRDDRMVEEHKGRPAEDFDSDLDDISNDGNTSQLINVKGRKSSSAQEEDFEKSECESDYEDQLDSLRQAKRRRREDTAAKENRRLIKSTFLPSSSKKMSACVSCRLVLNKEKWRKMGQCPNCPQS